MAWLYYTRTTMTTYRTVEEAQAAYRAKGRELRKTCPKTSLQAAVYMIAQAQALAPRHTGETQSGIRKRKVGQNYIVESRVNPKGKTGFMQNFWANQTAPYRTIHPRWARPKGSPVVYGDGSHHISGTPRFFHLATLRTRAKYVQLARANTQKALRVTT